jgi:dynactin complex subunit
MAYARYIGEVEGELGPWVGVEVPVGDSWGDDQLEEGRSWNDGSWGGIRYFEIGGYGSEWDYGDDRSTRRRIDRNHSEGLKREGDSLVTERVKRLRSASPTVSDLSNPESRGLFVRPQQVLYVVDAVGSDM